MNARDMLCLARSVDVEVWMREATPTYRHWVSGATVERLCSAYAGSVDNDEVHVHLVFDKSDVNAELKSILKPDGI